MKYKLNDTDKTNVFKAPDGYFEDLPLKIQSRIDENKVAHKSFVPPNWSLALAASVAILVTFIFLLPYGGSKDAEQMLASVSQEDLIAYLDLVEIDEYELASTIENPDELFEFEDPNVLEGIDIGDGELDDVLLEYDLQDEYL